MVLKETPTEADLNDDDDERRLAVTHKFKDCTYWNLDLTPSADDKIMQVMKWIDLAKVVYFNHLSVFSVGVVKKFSLQMC